MLEVEDLTDIQLMDTLLSIKMTESRKNRVIRAKAAFQSSGAIPNSEMKWLRSMFKSYKKAIKNLYESRERARLSMARKSMGLTKRDIQRRENQRLKGLKSKVGDFGI